MCHGNLWTHEIFFEVIIGHLVILIFEDEDGHLCYNIILRIDKTDYVKLSLTYGDIYY